MRATIEQTEQGPERAMAHRGMRSLGQSRHTVLVMRGGVFLRGAIARAAAITKSLNPATFPAMNSVPASL